MKWAQLMHGLLEFVHGLIHHLHAISKCILLLCVQILICIMGNHVQSSVVHVIRSLIDGIAENVDEACEVFGGGESGETESCIESL